MAGTYKTPGVYVEEIRTLPSSVVQVATAIPVFIGHTLNNPDGWNVPVRISSMNEFVDRFGIISSEKLRVFIKDTEVSGTLVKREFEIKYEEHVTTPSVADNPTYTGFLLFYQLQMFYANGGGDCYICPIEDATTTGVSEAADYDDVWGELEKFDEPTLIVMTDLPVNSTTRIPDAAAYGQLAQDALGHCNTMQDRFTIIDTMAASASKSDMDTFRGLIGTSYLNYGASYFPDLKSTVDFNYDDAEVQLVHTINGGTGTITGTLDLLETSNTSVFNQVKSAIRNEPMLLPPSGAIAGVYARVDNDRGVWKAPANVSLNRVLAPSVAITQSQQDDMNVDASTGKSVNAIRSFLGKGTLVWGARTLAGNDNEWRYVNVRRLFIMIEESVKKATEFVVFEPNDSGTWLRLKSMIESFLNGMWRDGALAGANPDEAFFVNIGLGNTMSSDDILNGRLIVEIGLAAVRPAEFIILKFSHKLQSS